MRVRGVICLVALGTLLATATASPGGENVKVYRFDGSLRCGMGAAIAPDVMENDLTALGVAVLAREKRQAPVAVPAVCGAMTGAANVYRIRSEDWRRIPMVTGTAMRAFDVWLYDAASAEVAKDDGSLQCNQGKAISLAEMEKTLAAAGVRVQARAKKSDGLAHIMACGEPTGMMNVYQIPAADWEKARRLGFVPYVEGLAFR